MIILHNNHVTIGFSGFSYDKNEKRLLFGNIAYYREKTGGYIVIYSPYS
jgi:hypothetical protein